MSAKVIMQIESHGGSVSNICYFQNLKQWRGIVKELKYYILAFEICRWKKKTMLTLDEGIVLAMWFAWY